MALPPGRPSRRHAWRMARRTWGGFLVRRASGTFPTSRTWRTRRPTALLRSSARPAQPPRVVALLRQPRVQGAEPHPLEAAKGRGAADVAGPGPSRIPFSAVGGRGLRLQLEEPVQIRSRRVLLASGRFDADCNSISDGENSTARTQTDHHFLRRRTHIWREIYMDGRAHPTGDAMNPTDLGHSVGRWEGDTLVVDWSDSTKAPGSTITAILTPTCFTWSRGSRGRTKDSCVSQRDRRPGSLYDAVHRDVGHQLEPERRTQRVHLPGKQQVYAAIDRRSRTAALRFPQDARRPPGQQV